MDKKSVDDLLEAAKISNDPTVKQALDKLLFVISIAHDKEYIKRANSYHFHSGCSITVPNTHENFTMSMVWNHEHIAIHARDYQFTEFKFGHMLQDGDPVPGVILIEDRNYQT